MRCIMANAYGIYDNPAKKLALDHPQVYFLLVGSRLPSDYDSSVNVAINLAEQFLGDRLILTAEREDIPALLASMDIFCLPSWREGMPRSIIEAMMMRLPVVATNIRGSLEEVVAGETGFLVPAKDIDRLHEKLEYLVNTPRVREEMGQRGWWSKLTGKHLCFKEDFRVTCELWKLSPILSSYALIMLGQFIISACLSLDV